MVMNNVIFVENIQRIDEFTSKIKKKYDNLVCY